MRVWPVLWAIMAVPALASCDGSSGATKSAKERAWNYASQDAVRMKLKDPESANFSDIYFSRKGGVPMTCGLVNAKNSFGGYTGPLRFISAGGDPTYLEDEVDGFDQVWKKYC